MPVETAIAYAKQLAAALEAAHEKGVVHRDLKPANIKITPDGLLKVLDFGLAKTGGESAELSGTVAPTLSMGMTEAGAILGTAAYMAPEQARGKPVDKRADIWAFGVVLYELLTGGMVFGGETASDSMAAVLTKEPDWSLLPRNTPAHVRRLLSRCLRKEPRQRMRDIGEARLALDEPEPANDDAAPVQANRPWLPWALAVVGMALGAVAVASWPRTQSSEPPAALFQLALPEGAAEGPSSPGGIPSPDGHHLAMVANKDSDTALWVRELDEVEPRLLEHTESARFPFWSPDSRTIAFFAGDKLKKVSIQGGAAQTICAIPRPAGLTFDRPVRGDGGTWSQENIIVFSNADGGPLMQVSADAGSQPKPAFGNTAGTSGRSFGPQFLPNGRHLLYIERHQGPVETTLYAQELNSTQRVPVGPFATRAIWAAPGYLLFMREGTLYAQRMDPKSYRLSGNPVALAEDLTVNVTASRAAIAVGGGVLTYRSGPRSSNARLAWYSRDGKRLGTVGKEGDYRGVRLSPDGKTAALAMGRPRLDL